MGTTVLHISDLHFGAYHDPALTRSGAKSLHRILLKDLNEAECKPECIVVSGDLATRGRSMSQAVVFVRELAKGLGLTPEDVVIVPGNHDLDWEKIEEARRQSDRYGLEAFRRQVFGNYELDVYQGFYGQDPDEPLAHRFWYTRCWHNDEVFILGLNSCMIDGPVAPGVGYVDEGQLQHAAKTWSDAWNNCQVRIAVIHHHLLPVSWTKPQPDAEHPSLTLNAEWIFQWLEENQFRIILHGHQHSPFYGKAVRYRTRSRPDNPYLSEVLVLGAGSVGSGAQDQRLQPYGRRQYQILKITGGSLAIESRSAHPQYIDAFSRDQLTVIPLRPSTKSKQLRRLFEQIESDATTPRFWPKCRQQDQQTVVGLDSYQLALLLPSILGAASNGYRAVTWLESLQPGEDDQVLKLCRPIRLVVGSALAFEATNYRQILECQEESGARIRCLEKEHFVPILERLSKKLFVDPGHICNTTRPDRGEASPPAYLRAFGILGPDGDSSVLLVVDPRRPGEPSTDTTPEFTLVFDPSPALLSDIEQAWTEAWGRARSLKEQMARKTSIATLTDYEKGCLEGARNALTEVLKSSGRSLTDSQKSLVDDAALDQLLKWISNAAAATPTEDVFLK